MREEDDREDKWDDLRSKAIDWWDNIMLIIIIVTVIMAVIFTVKHNDEGQIICAIVLGITIALKAGNPFDHGGKPFGGWF